MPGVGSAPATATAPPAAGSPRSATATTPPSSCSTRTPGPSTAGSTLRPEAFGHVVDERFAGTPDVRDGRDSAPFVPHGVVTGRPFDWAGDAPPHVPLADTVVYEAHVKGFTRRLPGVPEHLRGTYAGLAHPAAIEHLLRLGVTTVELLPIHAIGDEPWLVARGVPNYWGYSTLGYFAPEPRYAAATDPLDVVDEVKAMVRALHAAGLEVILDVVYNHTCEGGPGGPSLSWRGLDNATYYRLDAHGGYVDTTGCGNSLDFRDAAGRPADAGLAALLGRGDARRRVPLRPRADPRPAGTTASTPTTRSSSRPASTPCSAGSSSSPSRGTSAPTAGGPASSRRRSRSGTTASATASASSGSPAAGRWRAGEQAGGVRDLATRLAARPTSSPPTAGRSRRSTSSRRTTGSRSPT